MYTITRACVFIPVNKLSTGNLAVTIIKNVRLHFFLVKTVGNLKEEEKRQIKVYPPGDGISDFIGKVSWAGGLDGLQFLKVFPSNKLEFGPHSVPGHKLIYNLYGYITESDELHYCNRNDQKRINATNKYYYIKKKTITIYT